MTKLKYTLLCFMFIFFSVSLLYAALRGIPISVGYAVWTGIGSAGSVLMVMFLFKESKDMRKILLVSGIIICVIGLKKPVSHEQIRGGENSRGIGRQS